MATAVRMEGVQQLAPGVRSGAARTAVSSARPLGALQTLVTIGACLIIGHLAIRTFFPSVAVNAIGLVLVTLILFWVLFLRRDTFGFVLCVLGCSFFVYAPNQGGLFNVVAGVLGAGYLLLPSGNAELRRPDPAVAVLASLLFVSNLLGLLIRNPLPMTDIITHAVAFGGILLMMLIASRLELTEARLRRFLIVAGCLMAYNFAVSLNHQYSFVQIPTPLLGLNETLFYQASNAFGVFGSASANGQFAMMVLVVMIPMGCATAARFLRVTPLFFVAVGLLLLLTLVMANMRAAALEAVFAIVMYLYIFLVRNRRSFRRGYHLAIVSIIATLFLAAFGAVVGLQNLEKDLAEVETAQVGGLISGEDINRGSVWRYAWNVVTEGSWLIGYGHGNMISNYLAWGGKLQPGGMVVGGGHLHNLYLALPPLYGWVGAIAYVLLFLLVAARLAGIVWKYRPDRLPVVACLGFFMSLSLFLLDEVKSGNAVQSINYAMLAWIWLGLSLAAVRTARLDIARRAVARRAAAAESESSGPADGEPASAGGAPLLHKLR